MFALLLTLHKLLVLEVPKQYLYSLNKDATVQQDFEDLYIIIHLKKKKKERKNCCHSVQ